MQHFEVSGAVRPIYETLDVKWLMHQFLFYNEFIIHLYMFRAQLCSSSGGQNCITQHLVSSHSAGGRPMHRMWEDCSPLPMHRMGKDCAVLSHPVHRTVACGVWWYQMLCDTILTSWWWAQLCSKHVEVYNKLMQLSWSVTKIILRCTVSKTSKASASCWQNCVTSHPDGRELQGWT